MSLLFWRKTRDIAPENAQSVAVTEEDALPVRLIPHEEDDPVPTLITAMPDGSGLYVNVTHTAYNVTTTSSQALESNGARVYLLLINDSDTAIYIKFNAAAVANEGIRLNATGGSYEMSKKLGNIHPGLLMAIHAGTGNKVLLITEGT